MAAKKKSSHVPEVIYSVVRAKFLFVNGRRVRGGFWLDRFISSNNIAEYKSSLGISDSPKGVYGGPIPEGKEHSEAAIKFMAGILKKYSPKTTDEIDVRIRYHPTHAGSITADVPPAKYETPGYSRCDGYKTRANAEAAAQKWYDWACKYLVDDKGKPIQKVILEERDDYGALVSRKTNGYKNPKKPNDT